MKLYNYIGSIFLSSIFTLILYAQKNDTSAEINNEKGSAETFYDAGLTAYQQKNYLEAIGDFNIALQKKNDFSQVYYFLGLSQEKVLDLDGAMKSYVSAISFQPNFTEAMFSLAQLFYREKKYSNAIEEFDEILKTPPSETQAVYYRGLADNPNEPATGFNEILTMANKNADIYNYLGLSYWKNGDTNDALQNFNKSIQLFDNDDNVFVNRGLLYAQTGNNILALNDYNKALAINPYNRMAKFNKILLDKKDNESESELTGLINESEDSPDIYGYRAYLYYMEGKYDAALKDYDSAIAADNNDSRLYINRGMVYEKLGTYDAALKDYTIAGLTEPENPEIFFLKGNIYFKMKKYSMSRDMYTRNLYLDSLNGQAYYNRALSFYYLHDSAKACIDARKALILGVSQADRFVKSKCREGN